MVWAMVSPSILWALSKLPRRAFIEGKAPWALVLATMLAVPNSGRTPPLHPSFFMAVANCLEMALNATGSAICFVAFPSFETTRALRPLAPMTAPSPPRPAERLGIPRVSVAWMDAPASCSSPAGPMDEMLFLGPYSANSRSVKA